MRVKKIVGWLVRDGIAAEGCSPIGAGSMGGEDYCGNLLWQSSLTLLPPWGLTPWKPRYEKGYTSVLCGILSKRRQYESIEYRKYILSLLPRTEVAKAIKSDFGFDLSPEEINQIQFGKAKIDIMGEVVAGLMRESEQHR